MRDYLCLKGKVSTVLLQQSIVQNVEYRNR